MTPPLDDWMAEGRPLEDEAVAEAGMGEVTVTERLVEIWSTGAVVRERLVVVLVMVERLVVAVGKVDDALLDEVLVIWADRLVEAAVLEVTGEVGSSSPSSVDDGLCWVLLRTADTSKE